MQSIRFGGLRCLIQLPQCNFFDLPPFRTSLDTQKNMSTLFWTLNHFLQYQAFYQKVQLDLETKILHFGSMHFQSPNSPMSFLCFQDCLQTQKLRVVLTNYLLYKGFKTKISRQFNEKPSKDFSTRFKRISETSLFPDWMVLPLALINYFFIAGKVLMKFGVFICSSDI